MATPNTSSAKIFQFPAGGRSGLPSNHSVARPTANRKENDLVIMPESGWYHEAETASDNEPRN